MQRRTLLQAAAGAVATLGVPQLHAQSWPNGPVRIIVGFPPGGGTDALARVVGQKLGMMWNQQVIVENRAGDAGPVLDDDLLVPHHAELLADDAGQRVGAAA